MDIGTSIKNLREAKGLSQRELAKLSGISNTEISRIESGERKKVSPDILQSLSKPLGVTLESLLMSYGYLSSVGQVIKEARENKGLSVEELSRESKTPVKAIQKIESNEYYDDIEKLFSIADVLNLSRYEIYKLLIRSDDRIADQIYPQLVLQHLNTWALPFSNTGKEEADKLRAHFPELKIMLDEYTKRKKMAKWIDPNPEDLLPVPILSAIRSGYPLLNPDNIIGHESISINSYGDGFYFGLRAADDSMNASHINNGNVVVVKEQSNVENGEIAVVTIGPDDAIIRRVYRDNNKFTLLPSNPNYPPEIIDTKSNKIKILGKVIKVIISFA